MKSGVQPVSEILDRKLDRRFRAILTRSAVKIFRAGDRPEDFSHSQLHLTSKQKAEIQQEWDRIKNCGEMKEVDQFLNGAIRDVR